MTPAASVHDLKTLVLSRNPIIVIESVEEDRIERLVKAVAADLKVAVFEWTVTRGLVRTTGQGGVYGTNEPQTMLAGLPGMAEGIFLLKDIAPHLAQPVAARTLRDAAEKLTAPNRLSTLVLTGAEVRLPADIESLALRYDLQLPTREEYRQTIAQVVFSLQGSGRTKLELATADLDELSRALAGMTLNQARQAVAHVAIEDGRLSREDIPKVVALKAEKIRDEGLLEYFPAEDNYHELGGFGKLKEWLDRARVGFSDDAEALGLTPPRGVMIVGVQGCGKSLAAKVIARRWQLPLLKLDAGRLYDKFIGESEKNFRRAIALAESIAPSVLWIDEIEKGMAPAGGGESDSGLGRRLFGSFLTWLQEKREDVFVVATANDLSLLPPELLRKGRFDEVFFVDLPDPGEREEIFRIHLGRHKQDPGSFDLPQLVAAADGFSGAEIEQAVISALYRSLHEDRRLDTGTLLREIQGTIPLSVSRQEDIERLRHTSQGRFVPVG
jgi:SpoVK/Ycf46/Vps4 family AAA+-type ATPase